MGRSGGKSDCENRLGLSVTNLRQMIILRTDENPPADYPSAKINFVHAFPDHFARSLSTQNDFACTQLKTAISRRCSIRFAIVVRTNDRSFVLISIPCRATNRTNKIEVKLIERRTMKIRRTSSHFPHLLNRRHSLDNLNI